MPPNQINCTTIRSIYGNDEMFYEPEHTCIQNFIEKCHKECLEHNFELRTRVDKCCPPDVENFKIMCLMLISLANQFGMDDNISKLFNTICGLPVRDEEYNKPYSSDAAFVYYKSQLPELQLLARQLIAGKIHITMLNQAKNS